MEERTVVIVGAGPAGILAALFLAEDGWNVKVFEKRSDPVSDAIACRQRSIMIGLFPRGISAMEKAGIKLPQEGDKAPWLGGIAIAQGVTTYSSGSKAPALHKFKGPMITERAALVQHLTSEASRCHAERISITYKHSLHHIDFANRTAHFQPEAPAERPIEVQYDLCIGADGRHSVTRDLLARKVPDMRFEVCSAGRSWKSFADLPTVEGISAGDQNGAIWHIFSGGPTRIVAWPTARGKFAGYLTQSTSWFTEERDRAAVYEEVLRREAPCFPEEWIQNVAQQLEESPRGDIGTAWCSHISGPHTVLLGDAANAVTPIMGQGMNSALESAAMFAQILREHGNVNASCQAFALARLPDLHAVSQLDKEWPWRNGLKGRMQFRFLSTTLINRMVWGTLHKCLPTVFSNSEVAALPFSDISFTKVLHAVHRDDAILAALLASIPLLGAFGIYRLKQRA